MADNVELNAGSGGAILASDDIGGTQHQRVKVQHGADGSATDVSTSSPLPADLTNVTGTSGSAGPASALSVAGTRAGGELQELLADSSGHLQVDVVSISANDGVDIGDVDITSVVPGTGATNLGKAEDAAHSSGDTGVMALAVRNDSLAALAGTDGDYAPLQVDADGALYSVNREPPGRYDVFGRSLIASANNDVDVQFFRGSDPAEQVVVTTTNSGTATQNVGGALFTSSTDANGTSKGVTRQRTVYRSGSEIYCMFTASFTAGIASSYMRIGLYDDNEGFFIGYEGTSFGVTVRNNTSDTTVASGSFSEDALTGAAGSRFTRAGAAEAIDLTKLNVFRIRFGWLGSAPAYWEVMAPDGHWVTFHKTLFPNLQATPSIRDADLPMTLDIAKTAAAATDLQIQTDCWGAGATLIEQNGYVDPINSRFPSTLSANTSWNASGPWVDVHRYSLSKVLIYSSTNNAAGTLQVEFSMDGSTVHRTINYDVDDAATHPPHTIIPVAQYMRVSYDADAGGGNNHANFTVQTIHHVNANKLPTSKVSSTLDSDSDVDNVRAVIAGENPAAGGSYVNVKVDSGGLIQADIAADSVGLATAVTDDAAYTLGTDTGVMMMGYAGTQSVDSGDSGALAMDTDGALHVSDGGNSLTVDIGTAATGATDLGKAEDAAHTSGDVGVMALAVRNDDLAALAGTDGDYAPLQVTQNGALLMCPAANDDYKYAVIDDATSGNNTIVAAVASRKIRVLAAFLVAAGDVLVRFEDGAGGTALTGQMDVTTNSGFVLPFNPAGWFETSVNTLLNIELDGAVSVDGSLTYIEVP